MEMILTLLGAWFVIAVLYAALMGAEEHTDRPLSEMVIVMLPLMVLIGIGILFVMLVDRIQQFFGGRR